ncbi:hypothetical protein ACM55M_16685, partial [Flavobacterium sp. ZT3R25]|uniref:hypothetical protein n=1 Tax=Flavobacterium galactosi TaxID=3398735 RepID=UPI003A84885F
FLIKNGGGHFAPELGGHFELESGGHFKLESGGQYHWNLHTIEWKSIEYHTNTYQGEIYHKGEL